MINWLSDHNCFWKQKNCTIKLQIPKYRKYKNYCQKKRTIRETYYPVALGPISYINDYQKKLPSATQSLIHLSQLSTHIQIQCTKLDWLIILVNEIVISSRLAIRISIHDKGPPLDPTCKYQFELIDMSPIIHD